MPVERMGSSQQAPSNNTAPTTTDQSLNLAVAISLLRSKLLQRPTSLPESDALRWKRKAKERKQELLRLREDLKEAEDSSHCVLFSQSASCKCYFYDNLGKLSPQHDGDSSDRFSDVLRRRFVRQVRFNQRRKKDGPNTRRRFSDLKSEDEVDFLVDLCDTAFPARMFFTLIRVSQVQEVNFANWSHQAVDFILASLRNLLSIGKNKDLIEEIVSSLTMRLVRRMSSPSQGDGLEVTPTLGSVQYFQFLRISLVAENLLFMDPFDEAFPSMHRIQLIEFLVSDHLLTWSKDERFDNVLFEEWVMISLLHARKALELHESRNGLYMLYMDRVMGQLAKQVGQVSSFRKLNGNILDNLY